MEEKKKEYTDAEKLQMELLSLDVLQQYGVTIQIPLREPEISRLRARKSFLGKLIGRAKKTSLPGNLEPRKRYMPNPSNMDEKIEFWDVEVSIRPLYLATIDAIRSRRIEMELKDPAIKNKLETLDNTDDYMMRYTAEMCHILALATLNVDDERKYRKELQEWAEFYRQHLTNQRLIKLVSVVMMMKDVKSFQTSMRLILGMGSATTPREAPRIETKSGD